MLSNPDRSTITRAARPRAWSDVLVTRSRTSKKEHVMKSRKLEVEALDARVVPATLTVHCSITEPAAGQTTVVVSSPAPVPTPPPTGGTTHGPTSCKLAVNHNETLVCARHGGKARRW
jgi:hypothetical protein